MNILQLEAAPAASLAARLAEFEKCFSYPLGASSRFHISHGADYPRFFRAMGEATCLVAEDDGEVCGTLAIVRRQMQTPDGAEVTMAYLADLKVGSKERYGRTLFHLLNTARSLARGVHGAFGTVMEGTAAVPSRYTGRLGIPRFARLATVAVLHCATMDVAGARVRTASPGSHDGEACYKALSRGRFASIGGTPEVRTSISPVWLIAEGGEACGRLEDTRAAKRLWTMDGQELCSAHLSSFAYRDADSGAGLLRLACDHARQLGYPKLFTTVPQELAETLLSKLAPMPVTQAQAGIFGFGIESGASWNLNTAEI